MPIHVNLPVSHHQQDTNYYCGAACAQMVLDQIGAGLLGQDGLYTDNHDHSVLESGWYTAPDGLQWTLNRHKPLAFTNYFVAFALDHVDAISRKIAWTIQHYQVAPVALVYGNGHWIVVRGFQASGEPQSASDTSYAISAFDINNPWPYAESAPPPPHSVGDACGTADEHGVANEHVSYSAWQRLYMTGVPSGGEWGGKFVAVCDPEPPPTVLGQQAPARRRSNGEKILAAGELQHCAIDGLREFGLYERDSWRPNLLKSKPGKPVLVQRLDRIDSFYSIVPMITPERVAGAFVCVDARYGEYLQAVAPPVDRQRETTPLLLKLDPTAILKNLWGKRIDLPEPLGRLLVRKEASSLYPTLVWKPCRESLSPYYPFYMVTVGNHRVYVRVDGRIFTSLHDGDRGI